MAGLHEFERTVAAMVSTGLHRRFASYESQGIDVSELGDPAQFASRVLAALPAPHPWNSQFGPFYDTAGVTKLLGVSRQAIADRVKRHTLLGAATTSGRIVYPVFQFDGNHVDPRVSALTATFHNADVTGWAIASWLTTPLPDLDKLSPVDWVRAGNDPDRARQVAAATAQQWID